MFFSFLGAAPSCCRKAIKLGAIEINIENFYVRLNLDCTISKYERLCFFAENNKIIDILRKKFQENKKPIRQWCGLVKCGGGNGTRQSAERDCLQAEAERAV